MISDAQYGPCGLGSVWGEEDVESVESLCGLEKDAPMRRPQIRLRAHYRDAQHQQPVADGGQHTHGAHLPQGGRDGQPAARQPRDFTRLRLE